MANSGTPNFKDYFSTQANDYARYRPLYPKALFQQLAKACSAQDLAWDCGTGNGQAAMALAKHFRKVIATDPSAKQVEEAQAYPGVEYRTAPAEASTLEDHSADLITVAQAFHWFRQEEFFREVKRVAKPGGLLAVWCYGVGKVDPKIDALVQELYSDVLGKYWDPSIRLVEEGYRNEKFPFEEIAAPKATMGLSWTTADLIGFLGTWSALQKYRKETGDDPRASLIPRIQRAWGDPFSEKTVTWPLSIRLFRVS